MTNDELLDVAIAVNRQLRHARQEPEGPLQPRNPYGLSARELRLLEVERQKEDRRNGVNRRADWEKNLIEHLRRTYGESAESLAFVKPVRYERLHFPDYVNP